MTENTFVIGIFILNWSLLTALEDLIKDILGMDLWLFKNWNHCNEFVHVCFFSGQICQLLTGVTFIDRHVIC